MGCNYASNNEVVTKEVNRYPQLYSPKSLSSLVGIRSTRGMRMFNEDRYRIGKITENVHYIGLFDGFSGSLAADHVASTLHEHLYACLRNPFFRIAKLNSDFLSSYVRGLF
jgi:serine/threonine protein phosphatase PrpC